MVTNYVDETVLLAGVPRSGTTLVCNLLNGLENTVALVEPMQMTSLSCVTREAAVNCIGQFLRETRARLLMTGLAISGQHGGKIPDNMFAPAAGTRLRHKVTVRGECSFPTLDPDFSLVVKHPAGFTGLLDLLHRRYSCFAVIRNPLATLASWNTVDAPFENGHSPAAERFDAGLRSALAEIPGKLDRQIYLLSWYFETYLLWLAPERILRYEDIVTSPARTLSAITPSAWKLQTEIRNRDANPLYRALPIRQFGEALLKSRGAYWEFYSRQSVRELMDCICMSTYAGIKHDRDLAGSRVIIGQ